MTKRIVFDNEPKPEFLYECAWCGLQRVTAERLDEPVCANDGEPLVLMREAGEVEEAR